MNKELFTPFPTTKYLGPEYFCDRENEINTLLNNIKSHQSTTLISLRRMGKTGLLKHLQNKISDQWISVYIDILSTENMEDFLNTFSTSIVQAVPQKSTIGEKIWKFFKALNMSVSYDPINGEPSIKLHMRENESKTQVQKILQLLDLQNKPVLIILDEFQQITKYPEENMDAFLRTVIQSLQNVVFIFSGSQQQIMNDIFSNPQKPFYRSTSFLHLSEINREVYKDFIIQKFSTHERKIDEEVVDQLLTWTRQHTFYVQLACNRLFTNSEGEIDIAMWQNQAHELLKEQEMIFFTYRDMLTKPQWKLLKAIAQEGSVTNITSTAFYSKYDLGSSAALLRSLQSLLSKDLIYKKFDLEGIVSYHVYDTLLFRWLEKLPSK